jgi:all-trans-retinol dehydrogenase (NAD+)
VKPHEKTLNSYGIFPDPASNVSDLIVEQVIAGRSGQIFVPADQERMKNVRAWPLWVQDLLYGYPWMNTRPEAFAFGREENGRGNRLGLREI